MSVLPSRDDVFDGVTVDEKFALPDDPNEFDSLLAFSIEHWKETNRRGVWLKIPRSQSQLIDVAVRQQFYFHHTTKDSLTLCRWLPANEDDKLPLFAHTSIGVGAFVVNAQNEVLVIKEKTGFYKGWKTPGGMVDPGEDICDAAMREVREETGIETRFRAIECFRSTHDGLDNQTNLYFVVSLTPTSSDIRCQASEIAAGRWMPMAEFNALEFVGVYRALHEVSMQNAGATPSARSWTRHSLPVVFRRGSNTLYCSAESVLSARANPATSLSNNKL